MTYTFVMFLITFAMYQANQEWFLAEQTLGKIDRSWGTINHQGGTMAIPMVIAMLAAYCGSIYFALTSRRHDGSEA